MQQVLTKKKTEQSTQLWSVFLYGDDDTQTAVSCFLDLLRAVDVFGKWSYPIQKRRLDPRHVR